MLVVFAVPAICLVGQLLADPSCWFLVVGGGRLLALPLTRSSTSRWLVRARSWLTTPTSSARRTSVWLFACLAVPLVSDVVCVASAVTQSHRCAPPRCPPGASTSESQFRVARDIANYLSDALDEKKYVGIVNADSLGMTTRRYAAVQPVTRVWLSGVGFSLL